MPAESPPRNWGDPWIGLRHTAVDCLNLLDATALHPLPSRWPGQTPFGSPDIWEDIAEFFRNILYWINPANFLPWVWNSIVVPAWTWFRSNIYDPFVNWMSDRIWEIKAWFGGLWDSFKAGIWGATNSLWATIKSIYLWFTNTFGAAFEAIKSFIGNIYTWLAETARSLLTTIGDMLYNTYIWLSSTFTSLVTWFGDAIQAAIISVREAVTGVATKIWGAMEQFWWWLGARLNSSGPGWAPSWAR